MIGQRTRIEIFEAASCYPRSQPGLQWTNARFATRQLDGGADRVTLLDDRIKFRRDGKWTDEAVDPYDWTAVLEPWFGMTP